VWAYGGRGGELIASPAVVPHSPRFDRQRNFPILGFSSPHAFYLLLAFYFRPASSCDTRSYYADRATPSVASIRLEAPTSALTVVILFHCCFGETRPLCNCVELVGGRQRGWA
jgi:hypothetical protein